LKVKVLPELQSPSFHCRDATRSRSDEELSALMPSILDKAFKGKF
jgi:hypothetical protein